MGTKEKKLRWEIEEITAEIEFLEEQKKQKETILVMIRQDETIQRKAERGW